LGSPTCMSWAWVSCNLVLSPPYKSLHQWLTSQDTNGNNPNWGTPLNPYNSQYYPGGSSSGGASAVGSGLVPFALGSDGGGSVRIPSAYCGLYGLKTSHGRVSCAPLPRSANTTVINGPITSNMADLETYYRVLAQPDPSQLQSSRFAAPKRLTGPRKKVLGICKPWFDRAVPAVQEACQAALHHLTTTLGYEMVDIHMPYIHEGQTAHAMTILSEVLAEQPDMSILTDPNRILLKVAQSSTALQSLCDSTRCTSTPCQCLSTSRHAVPRQNSTLLRGIWGKGERCIPRIVRARCIRVSRALAVDHGAIPPWV
jgi:hypothetical protein